VQGPSGGDEGADPVLRQVGENLFGAKARVGGDLFGVDPLHGARGSQQRLEAVAIGGAGLHPLGEDDLMRAVDGIYEREREREREKTARPHRFNEKHNSGRDKAGRVRSHTICGILMHSSLAVTTEGLPLGLSGIKFWTRKKFNGTNALRKKDQSYAGPHRPRKEP
jgi:hypothetical protein